jgi:arginyl-tRNA synthetase
MSSPYPGLAAVLTDRVAAAAERAGFDLAMAAGERCVPTRDPAHGDFQSNVAFRLAKAARTNPRDVATRVCAELTTDDVLDHVAIAGAGFINLRVSARALADDVAQRAARPTLGAPSPGAGKTVVIDYSSPNIAKRMHVGHIRSTLIGNALHRIYAFFGWKVIADNHIGDWGTQFGALIVAWRAWRDDAAYAADAIGELQRIYQRFAEESKDDPTLVEAARVETAKLQAGDEENRALWAMFCAASLAEFERIYARLDVRFDVVLGESFYRDALDPLVDDLLARGLATVIDGAVQIPFPESAGPNLAQKPMIIRKSDGAALYGTTDLATAAYRRDVLGADRIVVITDLRQKLHFEQLFAACRLAGIASGADLFHVPFGMLRLSGGAVASTRKGNVVNLVDLLDAAVAHARAVVDEKSEHLPEAERAVIAERIGIAAIKYADLSQNPQSDVVFEWERMLSLEGNTAPYLMYAHARCRSLLARVEAAGGAPGPLMLTEPAERALALALGRTVEAAQEAMDHHRPSTLSDHLYAVANALSAFYRDCRVLGVDPDVQASRASLVAATANTLKVGLSLLGIEAIDRM